MTNEKMKDLLEKNTDLTPESVVVFAKPKDSPIHGYFDWDDKKAGHKWRINQARSLIRSVRLIFVIDDKTAPCVAFVRTPELTGKETGYSSISSIRSDENRKLEKIQQEKRSVLGSLERMKDILTVLESLDDMILVEQAIRLLNRVGIKELAKYSA